MLKRALCILTSAFLFLTSAPVDVFATELPEQVENVVEDAEKTEETKTAEDAEKTEEEQLLVEAQTLPALNEAGEEQLNITADTLTLTVNGDGWLLSPKTVLELIKS